MKLKSYIKEYRAYLKGAKQGADATVDGYLHDLNRYMEYFKEKVDESLDTFTINSIHVRGFVIFLREKNNSPATIERRLHGLMAFWRFLYLEHGFTQPPHSIKDLGIRLKKTRNPTRPLEDGNYLLLMEKIKNALSDID